MPIYTYNELIAAARRGEGFSPKAARDEAKKLQGKLRKAAEALSGKPETKELADSLTGLADAVKNVSARDLTRPNARDLARKGLETLNGLPELLGKKDPSGVSGYEHITRALGEQGEPAQDFRANLEFVYATLGGELEELELDGLEADIRRRAARPPEKRQPQEAAPAKDPPPAHKLPKEQKPPVKAPPPVQDRQPGPAQAPVKDPPPPQEPKPREKPKPVEFKDRNAPTDEEILSQDVFRIDDWIEERKAEHPEKKEAPRQRKAGEVSGVDLTEEFRAWNEGRPEEPEEAEIVQFREIRIPGKDAPAPGDAYEYDCGNHIRMAVDEQGRVYEKHEEIKRELEKPDRRLFVFSDDLSYPYAYENRDGRLYISEDTISPRSQLDGKPVFRPKSGLNPRVIAEISSGRIRNAAAERSQEEYRKIKELDDRIDILETDHKEAVKWIKDGEGIAKKPRSPGIGSAIWRGVVKTFTLGFGETKAYRNYHARVKDWEEEDAMHRRNLKELPGKEGKVQKLVYERDAHIREKRKHDAVVSGEISAHEKAKQEIESYRRNLEVRLEGVGDIIKNGKVTEHNVFANTWLKEAGCKGKTKDEPGAVQSLKEFIASRIVEREVLETTLDYQEYSARNTRVVGQLNSGELVAQIDRNGVLREILEEQGKKPIDPNAICNEYCIRTAQREKELNQPLGKLRAARQALIQQFGQKPVTESLLRDVMHLNLLDASIREAEKPPKELNYQNQKEDKAEWNRKIAAFYDKKAIDKATANAITPKHEEAMREVIDRHSGETLGLEEITKLFNQAMVPEKDLESAEQAPAEKAPERR